MNFKRISAIASSILLTGMTLGMAAASAYPAPFVSGSTADVGIVYGANAATSDIVQTANIQTDLQSQLGSGGTTVTTTCAGGDCFLVEQASSKLNIYDNVTDIKSGALDETELPNVLADGTYTSGDGNDYGYVQEIQLYSTQRFNSFADKDYNNEIPALGIHIDKNDYVMNYTLSWKKAPESDRSSSDRLEDLENSDIEILGKNYKILNAYVNNSGTTNPKLELMGGAIVSSVDRDTSVTHTLEGDTYTIRPSYISDTKCKLCISINGGAEEACSIELEQGETTKLSNGVQLGVRAINYAAKAGTTDSIDFSLGAEKITIQGGQTVEINDDDINGLKATMSVGYSGSKHTLSNIILTWQAKEEYFAADNNEIVLPGIGGIKFASGGYYTPAEEEIKVSPGSQRIELVIPIKDGTANIPLLYGNETTWTAVGSDDDKWLHTTNNTVLTWNETDGDYYFVATWNTSTDYESYFLSVLDVYEDSGINYSKIKNEVTGEEVCNVKNGNDCKVGSVVLTTANSDPDDDYVQLTGGTGVSFNKVYSTEGAMFWLPVYGNTSSGADPYRINMTRRYFANPELVTDNGADGNATDWVLQMQEEDKNGNLGEGENINFTLAWSGDRTRVSQARAVWGSDAATANDPDLETEDGSDEYVDWVKSDLGTKVLHKKPSGSDSQYSADITYFGDETYGLIYVAGEGADIGQVSTSTSSGTAQLGNVIVKDNEVSSVASKNLIIVGGSCINTAAATALGVSSGTCGAAFTEATTVGTGQFLIESVSGKFASGKIALVVAGYDAADTQNAATYLTSKQVETAAGTKYVGTSATEATLQTTTA